jgi:hypothetical protein
MLIEQPVYPEHSWSSGGLWKAQSEILQYFKARSTFSTVPLASWVRIPFATWMYVRALSVFVLPLATG